MSARSSRVCSAAFAALLVIASSFRADANDAAYGGSAQALRPIHESRVQMVSENIVATLDDEERFRVSATYVFRNASEEPVELQLGFPERCSWTLERMREYGTADVRPLRFEDLRTWVDGEEAEVRVVDVAPGDSPPDLQDLCRTHLIDTSIDAGASSVVRHTYAYFPTSGLYGTDFEYVTRTGALWSGPIGTATFTVRVPWWPSDMRSTLAEPTIEWGGRFAEVRVHARQWTPERDVQVSVGRFVGEPAYESESVCGEAARFVRRTPRHGTDESHTPHVWQVLRRIDDLGACDDEARSWFVRPEGEALPASVFPEGVARLLRVLELERRRRAGVCGAGTLGPWSSAAFSRCVSGGP